MKILSGSRIRQLETVEMELATLESKLRNAMLTVLLVEVDNPHGESEYQTKRTKIISQNSFEQLLLMAKMSPQGGVKLFSFDSISLLGLMQDEGTYLDIAVTL